MKKIVLCGTPAFVIPFFDIFLLDQQYSVEGVITRAPKMKNNKILDASSVAKWARSKNLSVYEVKKINHDHEIKYLLSGVDCVLVFAFGQIISEELLNLPKEGFFNIHPSKLPLLRGPSPLQSAILKGFDTTSLTLMKMNIYMDEGEIINQVDWKLCNYHNLKVILQELGTWGPKWILENLNEYIKTKVCVPQVNEASYCNLIKKADYYIQDDDSAELVLNKIRALGYVILQYKNIQFKCFLAKKANLDDEFQVNGVTPIFLQLPGKKIMHIRSFLNGFRK